MKQGLTDCTTQTIAADTSRAGFSPIDLMELCREKLNSYQHVKDRELGRENVMDKGGNSIETFDGSDPWRSFFDSLLRFISEKVPHDQGMKFCSTRLRH